MSEPRGDKFTLRRAAFVGLLSTEDVERWEAFMREPKNQVVDKVHDWLCAECGLVDSKEFPTHPRRVSRSSVHNELRKFLLRDRYSAAADIADAIYSAQAENGSLDLAKAAQLQLSQELLTQLTSGAADPSITKALYTLARTTESLSRTGRHNVKYEQELSELKRRGAEELANLKGESKKRTITEADLERVSKLVFGS